MTRDELVVSLRRDCPICGHAFVSHPCAPRLVSSHETDFFDFRRTFSHFARCAVASCPCTARWFVMGEIFTVVVKVSEMPCCGGEAFLLSAVKEEQEGAPWRTKCAACKAEIVVTGMMPQAVQ